MTEAPRELRLNASAHSMEIAWDDGSIDAVAFAVLREQCRCAECASARRQGRAVAAPADIALIEAVPYGPNAVQLVFSDGHSRGIFPFSYLRELVSRAPDPSVDKSLFTQP